MKNHHALTPDPRKRVLVTCPTFEPGFRGGGPIRSVAQIVDDAEQTHDLMLFMADRDLGAQEPYPGLSGSWISRGRTGVFYLNVRKPFQWVRLVGELRRQPVTFMYLNSMWQWAFSLIPIVFAPRIFPSGPFS